MMYNYNLKSISQLVRKQNLLRNKSLRSFIRLTSLLIFLTCTIGTSSVKAQFTAIFFPLAYNTSDPTNTNWNEPKNWNWYPGASITGDYKLEILQSCISYIDIYIGEGVTLDVKSNLILNADFRTAFSAVVTGDGNLDIKGRTRNYGNINCSNLIAAEVDNYRFIKCDHIDVEELLCYGTYGGKSSSRLSFKGDLRMYGAEFSNNGSFNGNLELNDYAKFYNTGNITGRILNSSNFYGTCSNEGNITLSESSTLYRLENKSTGVVTNNNYLFSGGIITNDGQFVNNSHINISIIDENRSEEWTNNGTLVNNGSMSLSDNVKFFNRGILKGSSTIGSTNSWTNNGILSPGNSPGKLIHNGQYYENGTLLIEIGGTVAVSEYDVFEIGIFRSHTINTGSLEVQLINGFNPVAGNFFKILNAPARGGTFSTVNLPALNPGLEWEIEYNSTDITLRVAAIVVPVTWLEFTISANEREDNKVELTWSTAEEINNLGFEVERSQDAQTWRKIGFEAAESRSEDQSNYEHIDLNPESGTNYYRLKQLDVDGQYDYSVIRSINLRKSEAHDLKIFPNPSSSNFIQASFNNAKYEFTSVSILDMNGKVVYKSNIDLIKGETDLELSTTNLNSGTYILRLSSNQDQIQRKWIKL